MSDKPSLFAAAERLSTADQDSVATLKATAIQLTEQLEKSRLAERDANQRARYWESEWRRLHQEYQQALHDLREGRKPQPPTGRSRSITLSDDLI